MGWKVEGEWLGLGKRTWITATNEPLPVHSHSPTADVRCFEGQKHYFFFFSCRNSHLDPGRKFRSKNACMQAGSSNISILAHTTFVGGIETLLFKVSFHEIMPPYKILSILLITKDSNSICLYSINLDFKKKWIWKYLY